MMQREEIERAFDSSSRGGEVTVERYPLRYNAGKYAFLRVASKNIAPGDKVLMIGAGVHANEKAGPITLARYGPQMIARAHARGLKLVLYPLRNPSAWGIPGKRYNIDVADADAGIGNNDFVRYELPDGRITDDLRDGVVFRSWGWASESRFGVDLPPETRLMHTLLAREPLAQVGAVLDLHQDYYTHSPGPLAYQYAFGDLGVYTPITDQVERIIPLARDRWIGAGYAALTVDGLVTRDDASQAIKSDARGFIARHDGTWTDLMYRTGEQQSRRVHCITPETTGSTPLDLACQVNLIWIYGVMDLLQEP